MKEPQPPFSMYRRFTTPLTVSITHPVLYLIIDLKLPRCVFRDNHLACVVYCLLMQARAIDGRLWIVDVAATGMQ